MSIYPMKVSVSSPPLTPTRCTSNNLFQIITILASGLTQKLTYRDRESAHQRRSEREKERHRQMKEAAHSLLVVVGSLLLYLVWKVVRTLLLEPRRIQKLFEAQGIKCLPYSILIGNLPELVAVTAAASAQPMPKLSHDIVARIFPHHFLWSKKYGEPFVYWFGAQARFTLTEPEQAKEILSKKFGHYQKPAASPDILDLTGKSLVRLHGEKWAERRRIMNPAFSVQKLKAMAHTTADCTAAMMERWDVKVAKGEAIDMHENFRTLTADIIAHTAFGSSYAEGKQVFEMQHEQQFLIAKAVPSIHIPGSRFMPTATNRYRWEIKKTISAILAELVERRMEEGARIGYFFGDDLLGLMMAANKGQLQRTQKKNLTMGVEEIIDECKTFFFAGHETTSTLLTWTCMLLASNPEWQERVREEVQRVCRTTQLPLVDSASQLKLLEMVLNEALRLYPPASEIIRVAVSDMQLGRVVVPAGTALVIPIVVWHHHPKFWGADADEFRPDRFAGGVSNASRVPGAFLPFSTGPRSCIGQTFGMLEAKVVLSCIVQKYRFRLSPEYKHAPMRLVSLQPQFGMPMLLEKIARE